MVRVISLVSTWDSSEDKILMALETSPSCSLVLTSLRSTSSSDACLARPFFPSFMVSQLLRASFRRLSWITLLPTVFGQTWLCGADQKPWVKTSPSSSNPPPWLIWCIWPYPPEIPLLLTDRSLKLFEVFGFLISGWIEQANRHVVERPESIRFRRFLTDASRGVLLSASWLYFPDTFSCLRISPKCGCLAILAAGGALKACPTSSVGLTRCFWSSDWQWNFHWLSHDSGCVSHLKWTVFKNYPTYPQQAWYKNMMASFCHSVTVSIN